MIQAVITFIVVFALATHYAVTKIVAAIDRHALSVDRNTTELKKQRGSIGL